MPDHDADRTSSLPPLLDHVVVATNDLDATVAEVAACTGVRPVPGGEHPQMGTRNYLVGLGGDSYVEFIGAVPGSTPARPRPFHIDEATAPVAANWAVHTPDPDCALRAANRNGVPFGELHEGRRRTAEGELIRWRLTQAYAVEPSGLVPFVIDWGATPSPARTVEPRLELRRLSATHSDPEAIRGALRTIGTDLDIAVGDRPVLHFEICGPKGCWSPSCRADNSCSC